MFVVASFTYIEKAFVDKYKTSDSLSVFRIYVNKIRVLFVHCLESFNPYIFMFDTLGEPKQLLYVSLYIYIQIILIYIFLSIKNA